MQVWTNTNTRARTYTHMLIQPTIDCEHGEGSNLR